MNRSSFIHNVLLILLLVSSLLLLILWIIYSPRESEDSIKGLMFSFILWGVVRSCFFSLIIMIVQLKKLYSEYFRIYGMIICAALFPELLIGLTLAVVSSVTILQISILMIEFVNMIIILFLDSQYFLIKPKIPGMNPI